MASIDSNHQNATNSEHLLRSSDNTTPGFGQSNLSSGKTTTLKSNKSTFTSMKKNTNADTSINTKTTSTKRNATKTTDGTQTKPKRKKAYRACLHCQKAHLTCDDSRPCQRCIKRNLGDTCKDGTRKRAKYLIDVLFDSPDQNQNVNIQVNNKIENKNNVVQTRQMNDLQPINTQLQSQSISDALQSNSLLYSSNTQVNLHDNKPLSIIPPATIAPNNLLANNQLNTISSSPDIFDPLALNKYDFGSEAANLEYSILSDILGNDAIINTPQDSTTGSDFPSTYFAGSESPMVGYPEIPMVDSTWKKHNLGDWASFNTPDSSNHSDSPIESIMHATPAELSINSQQNMITDNNTITSSINDHISTSLPFVPSILTTDSNSSQPLNAWDQDITPQLTQVFLSNTSNNNTNGDIMGKPLNNTIIQKQNISTDNNPFRSVFSNAKRTPQSIYESVTEPFPYTAGFHSLIKYLKSRFDEKHLMCITRAMAAYRPSFIACTKTLVWQDLIFMEKSFQRMLLEYEKFIGYSGTPTIIWRRTGQIAAVGKEFCILTGWKKQDLLNGPRFFFELIDNDSVIKYFEIFSQLAFGDTHGSYMGRCTLLNPNNCSIKTACSLTVKRDIFNIPMIITGSFLPIFD